MQLKGLLVSAVAVAAVSAQTFELNKCSECVFASFGKNAVCAKLPADQMANLTSVFNTGTLNTPLMMQLAKEQAIKDCMCDWKNTAFTPTGAAATCFTGDAAPCNASQVEEAKKGMGPVDTVMRCNANGGSGAQPSGGAKPTATDSGKGAQPTGAASMINVPYVLSVAAVGVAAFLGL
ncbi:hypothetical protein BGW42_005734 [Actinomortierella wolfii]|nr:hypothetical protein BGW42_005734 [Actinomortierella wolfii]KAG0241925.1 hypothetical protein BGW41_005090 [Actinomortierella wolfii]